MNEERILALLDQIAEACEHATSFVEGYDLERFLGDIRTQQAVAMSLMVMGEAVARLHAKHPEFLQKFPTLPWQEIRGMRNRIARGYFDLDLETVFDTVSTSVPSLKARLPAMFEAASTSSRDNA